MFQKTLLSMMLLAALFSLTLMPAADSAASGGLSVSLTCENEPHGAICWGSPSGNGNTFAWNTTGNLIVSTGGTNSPIRFINCWGFGSGGTVTVTVTATNGDSGSASRPVSCDPFGLLL